MTNLDDELERLRRAKENPPNLWDTVAAEHDKLMSPAAVMNAVGSPTGRVMTDSSSEAVDAARSFSARSHRAMAHQALRESAGGLTSIEVARLLPAGRDGNPQNSNRASTRLGELWEEKHATILRSHGSCSIGVCHPHFKPSIVHRPTADCEQHGRIIRRDGAAVWIALEQA